MSKRDGAEVLDRMLNCTDNRDTLQWHTEVVAEHTSAVYQLHSSLRIEVTDCQLKLWDGHGW